MEFDGSPSERHRHQEIHLQFAFIGRAGLFTAGMNNYAAWLASSNWSRTAAKEKNGKSWLAGKKELEDRGFECLR
jgi:hypothetical protein